jgi:transposase
MTAAERIVQLEAENAALRAALAAAQQQVACLSERLRDLEQRLAKDSHTSSKPPSSDGLSRRPRSQRERKERKSGAQLGHPGQTLAQVASPDVEVRHRPSTCGGCQCPLEGVTGQVVERRQVQDLPPLKLVVTEHQVEAVRCPQCQQVTRGAFPPEVTAPAQYGPHLRALAVYLNQYQLLPERRTGETLTDLVNCALSDGAIACWVQEAAERLTPTVAQIADLVAASPVQHADETGVRVGGRLHWLHVNSTRWLTHLAWHPKRGQQALEAIGIWPRFAGWAIHDRWASYAQYVCLHSLCKAHLLRDLTFLAEEAGQAWAADRKTLLTDLHAAVGEWQQRGVRRVPSPEREDWLAQYFAVLAQGYAAQAPPTSSHTSKQRGRQKQSPAKNLLDALLHQAEQVLAFVEDGTVPFTNNQAERDLRMVKVQQKISGTFRSPLGATAFCRIRSYLSTMRKQGRAMLPALRAVFLGRPFPIAWGI